MTAEIIHKVISISDIPNSDSLRKGDARNVRKINKSRTESLFPNRPDSTQRYFWTCLSQERKQYGFSVPQMLLGVIVWENDLGRQRKAQ